MKEGDYMHMELKNSLERSAVNFKKLSTEKKMFILGYMEGVLSSEQKKDDKQKEIDKELYILK